MTDEIRPLPYDPSAKQIVSMVDLDDAEWLFGTVGDYQCACVEAMRNDGSNYQTCIALEYPVRVRNTDEHKTLRLIITPESAEGLANALMHSVNWLEIARKLGN